MEPVNGNCTGDFCTWKKCVQEKVIMFSESDMDDRLL